MSSYFGLNPDTIDVSVYDLFEAASHGKSINPVPAVVKTNFQGLFLLPAASGIATLDRQCATAEGMGLVITRALSMIADNYDYVLIDSPPMLGVLMINALAACEHLIVPVSTEFLAIKGLERMLRTLGMIQKFGQ